MATAHDLINRALRLAKVQDAAEAASAEDAENALDTLNFMLAEWYESDIRLPDYTFPTLTTALASSDADFEAIAHKLAERVAPEYGATLDAQTIANSRLAFARLRARYFQPRSPVPSLYY